ncbi:hypothetical protein PAMA_000165 [Pampus argenteus]
MPLRAARSHLVLELACFPWDPLAWVSAPLPELLRTRGGCWRCNITPPTTYMEQPPCPSSLSSACLTSNTLAAHCSRKSLQPTTTTTPAAMDVSYCSTLQLQDNSFLFDCESLLDKCYNPLAYDPASDPGYFSAGSSLSPTSSVDSFCFSPTSLQANEKDALDCFIFSSPAAPHPTHETQTLPCSTSSTKTSSTKKSRSRYPGKKRQTASEREKLRMRDLTKALNHLRGYLPPSVAPAGQTLTKIETLRLTIRYISYLSAQLGLSEEVLEQRSSSSFVEQPQTLNQFLGEPSIGYNSQESDYNTMSTTQLSSLQHSYQVPSGVSFSEQYWMPQQQLQNDAFPGQC